MKSKHYITGATIIAIAFLLQPFSLLFVQTYVAPVLAEKFLGQNTDGSVSVEGKEIDSTNLKVSGNPDAQIYLVEYSDYQCPFCSRFHSTPKEIVAQSNGKVAWVWKHFPLEQIHPEARPAGIAAECVAKLGSTEKFWQYTDVLIANQENLSSNLYSAEAAKLGINAQAFATCLKDPSMDAIVTAHLQEGESLGVSGTPSTFVVKNENGKLTILENINGALPKATVESIIAKYSE
jgi:protein-disulfide isomerase